MLSTLIDVFRLRQYFNAVLMVGDVASGLREDVGFIDSVRRSVLPLPFEDPRRPDPHPFGPLRRHRLPALEGKRVGLLATGGSGALASVTGVWRAFEEAGIRPEVVSVCSGSSLFGFPLAAGFSAEEVAEFVLTMSGDDYVDINWTDLARGVVSAGRGFAGIIKGDRLEEAYRRLVGDMTLGEMPIPCYAPLWNIEENRVEYVGPTTHPDMPVARAIRGAISIPLFIDPMPIEDRHWCDGGIVDIFPVRPVLDFVEPLDVVVAVNGFYPAEFEGESAEGWREQSASVFRIASQVRSCQQIELARVNLRLLREHVDTLMINPVPYSVVRGVGFYRQFIDRTDWPEFMQLGRHDAAIALNRYASQQHGARNGAARNGARPKRAGAAKRSTGTAQRRRRATATSS